MLDCFDKASQKHIEVGDLRSAKAVAIVDAVRGLPFVELIECRADNRTDFVYVEVQPEVPSSPVNDIQVREPIAIAIDSADKELPEALALRPDFPSVPHLNLRQFKHPKSLCLSEQPVPHQRLCWRAAEYIKSIHSWLTRTATGDLHGDDQPLEPLLLASAPKLVVPKSVLYGRDALAPIQVHRTRSDKVYVAETLEQRENEPVFGHLGVVTTAPHVHGVIEHRPADFAGLGELLDKPEFSLTDRLTQIVRHLTSIGAANHLVFLLLRIQKVRAPGERVEAVEPWALVFHQQLGQLAQLLGVGEWSDASGDLHFCPYVEPTQRETSAITFDLLDPVPDVERLLARQMSGKSSSSPLAQSVAVGVGALGSQLLLNLYRSGGFEKLHVVDKDHILPHNLVRHDAPRLAIGWSKSQWLQWKAGTLMEGAEVTASEKDVLKTPHEEWFPDYEPEVLLDCSASVPVGRFLANDLETDVRRVSAFLSPSGRDSVLLVESADRSERLDELEMEYYRTLVHNDELLDHLAADGQVRYGHSCRDLSAKIPQHLVGMHAGTLAGALEPAVGQHRAIARLWRSGADGRVQPHSAPVSQWIRLEVGSWDVRVRADSVRDAMTARAGALPSETGGVILGSYDMQRRILYVVDMWTDPSDSKGSPYMFIRGCDGLAGEVAQASNLTGGWLHYVGEWHSHPPTANCSLSNNDRQQLHWLQENLARDGLPPVMVIVCEGAEIALVVGDAEAKFQLAPDEEPTPDR